jgi:hypothetical protein
MALALLYGYAFNWLSILRLLLLQVFPNVLVCWPYLCACFATPAATGIGVFPSATLLTSSACVFCEPSQTRILQFYRFDNIASGKQFKIDYR